MCTLNGELETLIGALGNNAWRVMSLGIGTNMVSIIRVMSLSFGHETREMVDELEILSSRGAKTRCMRASV